MGGVGLGGLEVLFLLASLLLLVRHLLLEAMHFAPSSFLLLVRLGRSELSFDLSAIHGLYLVLDVSPASKESQKVAQMTHLVDVPCADLIVQSPWKQVDVACSSSLPQPG